MLLLALFLCGPISPGGALFATGTATISPSFAAVDPIVHEETVALIIRFGERREPLVFEDLPWREDMTVEDVMKAARERDESFAYRSTGRGETFFVKEIAGYANEGRSGDNWVFRVNDKLGDRSAAVIPVNAGDRVEWRLGKYRIDDE